jgi:hypothetical protein
MKKPDLKVNVTTNNIEAYPNTNAAHTITQKTTKINKKTTTKAQTEHKNQIDNPHHQSIANLYTGVEHNRHKNAKKPFFSPSQMGRAPTKKSANTQKAS